jgi:hypothetical protein
MPRIRFLCCLACLLPLGAGAVDLPNEAAGAGAPAEAVAVLPADLPDPVVLEAALQRLDWPSFRHVIESVPKLRADVDAYGAFGWEYVKSHYTTYGWRKNIGRLKDDQKRQLAELIRQAQKR